jgi:hypothetical protein
VRTLNEVDAGGGRALNEVDADREMPGGEGGGFRSQ